MIIFETSTTPVSSTDVNVPLLGTDTFNEFIVPSEYCYVTCFSVYFGASGITVPSGAYLVAKIRHNLRGSGYKEVWDEKLVVTPDTSGVYLSERFHRKVHEKDRLEVIFSTNSDWSTEPARFLVNLWTTLPDLGAWQYGNFVAPDMKAT